MFLEGQNVIDREIRGVQQRSQGRADGLTEAEYEVLLDITIGLTDQAIAERRKLSLRSVQGRLQQLYGKLGIIEMPSLNSGAAQFNSRTRAIAVALMSRLINEKSIEAAELEFRRGGAMDD